MGNLPLYSISYSIPYLFFLCILTCIFLYEQIPYKSVTYKTRINAIVFLSYIFIFFIGFRGYINTDWRAYMNAFQSISFDSLKISDEPLFWGLCLLSKKIFNSYTAFVVLSTFLDLIFFVIAFKHEKSLLLCFITYFLFSGGTGFRLEVNLLRNVKAILLFAISLYYLESKKIKQYYLINLIGCFFHISALIYFFLPILITRKWSKKTLMGLFILGNFIVILHINWIVDILLNLGNLVLPGRLNFLLRVYLNSDRFSAAKGIGFGYIERVLIFLITYWCICNRKIKYQENTIYINLLFTYCLTFFFFNEMTIMTDRFALLFLPGLWFSFPRIYHELRKSGKWMFLVIYFLYFFLKYFLAIPPVMLKYDNMLFPHMSVEKRDYYIHQIYKE